MHLIVLSLLLGILFQNVSGNTSTCSTEDLRTCRADALEQMSGSSSRDSAQQEKQCSDLRDNYNCILWQTSMCFKKEDQDSNSDIIWKTWRYLGGFCEKSINWWASSCFQRDDIKRCESLLPSKRNSLDGQSCRTFVNFRDCVTSITSSSCSNSDRSLLGSYLTEKGQQMAWRCPKDSDGIPLPAASAQQVDRRYPDDMYRDSGDNTCMVTARSELQDCQQRFQNTQSDAMRRDDSDMRNHRLCCGFVDLEKCLAVAVEKCGTSGVQLAKDTLEATKSQFNGLVHFEECVRYAINRRCSRDVRRLTEDYVYPVRSRLNNNCRDHTTYSCNSANSFIPQNAVAAYLAAFFLYFMHVKSFF